MSVNPIQEKTLNPQILNTQLNSNQNKGKEKCSLLYIIISKLLYIVEKFYRTPKGFKK